MKQPVEMICMYCKKIIETQVWEMAEGQEPNPSHGACKPCKDKEIRKIRKDKALAKIASFG